MPSVGCLTHRPFPALYMVVKQKSRLRSGSIVPCGRIFQFSHLIFDICAVSLAWRIALEIRLLLNPYLPMEITRSTMDVVALRLIYVLLLWIGASLLLRTYRDTNDRSLVMAFLRVAESAVVVSALAITVTFFSRQLGTDLSRSFVLIFAPICFMLLTGSLAFSIYTTKQIRLRWSVPERVALVGRRADAEAIVHAIGRTSHQNVLVRGVIFPANAPEEVSGSEAGGVGVLSAATTLPALGALRQLAVLINQECLNRIIIAGDCLSGFEEEFCHQIASRMGVTVTRTLRPASPDLLVRYQSQYGMHLIDITAAPFTHWQEVIKRAMDVLLSLALITSTLPLLVLIAGLVRVTSNGPVLYASRRVGKGGRYFTFWKFRSMYVSGPARAELALRNEQSGHIFKIRQDPRITPVGRVLRRLSLDELPQLFNVLAGDMSLVGPRPLPAEDLDPDGMSEKFAEWATERSMVKPGITGLWQVRGRSELPFTKMMELDVEYIRNWSISLDLGILLETPRAIFSGIGAY